MPTVFGPELLCYTVEVGAESRAEGFLPQLRLLPQVFAWRLRLRPERQKKKKRKYVGGTVNQ